MTFSRIGQFPLLYMGVTKGVLAVSGALVTLALRWLYRRMLRRGVPFTRQVVIAVAASYAASLPWTLVGNAVAYPFGDWLFGRAAPVRGPSAYLSGAVYHAFILLAWSLLYLGARHYVALAAERERAARAEALAHEARLQALRFQLQPHFLFNTLNAISTLVVEQRTDEASRMLARLSQFLRLTLDEHGTRQVTLDEELELVGRYLEIEQVRFADRLRVCYAVAADARAALVPALLLQPLVENAVRYAVAPREEGGTLAIEARRDGDRLLVSVADDGPGLPAGAAPRGIGLRNVRERLEQLYGDAHQLRLAEAAGGGLQVTIALPFAV